jgi:hypothetical protein
MKLKLSLLILILFIVSPFAFTQTPKRVNTFPEDYVGKTITFRNIAFWPTLHELGGYYSVNINISDDPDSEQWGFDSLNKIYGGVGKAIAKQIINSNGGGYDQYLYGTVVGKVIKTSKVFGSKYVFLITKIINHPVNEPQNVVHVFAVTDK